MDARACALFALLTLPSACSSSPPLPAADAGLPADGSGTQDGPPRVCPGPAQITLVADTLWHEVAVSPSRCAIAYAAYRWGDKQQVPNLPPGVVQQVWLREALELASLDLAQRRTLTARVGLFAFAAPRSALVYQDLADRRAPSLVMRESEGLGEPLLLAKEVAYFELDKQQRRTVHVGGSELSLTPRGPVRVLSLDDPSTPLELSKDGELIAVSTEMNRIFRRVTDADQVLLLEPDDALPTDCSNNSYGALSWVALDGTRHPIGDKAAPVLAHAGTGRTLYETLDGQKNRHYTVAFPKEDLPSRTLWTLPPRYIGAHGLCSGKKAEVGFSPGGRRLVVRLKNVDGDAIAWIAELQVYDLEEPAAPPDVLSCGALSPIMLDNGVLCPDKDAASVPRLRFLGYGDGASVLVDTQALQPLRLDADRLVYQRLLPDQPRLDDVFVASELRQLSISASGPGKPGSVAEGYLEHVMVGEGDPASTWVVYTRRPASWLASSPEKVGWQALRLADATRVEFQPPFKPRRVLLGGKAVLYGKWTASCNTDKSCSHVYLGPLPPPS